MWFFGFQFWICYQFPASIRCTDMVWSYKRENSNVWGNTITRASSLPLWKQQWRHCLKPNNQTHVSRLSLSTWNNGRFYTTDELSIWANYSLSPGVWQSFVTIRSCNHLMRIIQRMSTIQRKVRSREDDNYSNWVIINYGVYKGLYHISCFLQIIKPFIRPPQGLLFLVVKTF